jgi:uncharacterized PurR-regulated membrane protein YhhQ (DUF165 family)
MALGKAVRARRAIVWFIAYIAAIVLANVAIRYLGFVTVAPGIVAPAGVFFAGFAFTFRDFLQEYSGRSATIVAIFAGAALSGIFSPQFAVPSAVAFLASELLDFAVYTPLRKQHWMHAVMLSNIAGDVLDSLIFLWLAFGSLQFLVGQIVGKWETIVPAMICVYIYKKRAHQSLNEPLNPDLP